MLKVEYLKTEQLVPYAGNAKRHPEEQIEQIKKSIAEFGFNDPIAIWRGNEIIEGHGRLIAATELGVAEVPVIRLDDLTDEQRKAYALVHNKLTMNSDFDLDVLGEELANIIDIDMIDFGFDLPDDTDDQGDGYYGDERERTSKAYNLDLLDANNLTDNFWQMPIIRNDGHIPKDLIGFNYAKTSDNKDAGIHFYVDDYQFERIWNDPDKYVDILMDYDCILSPDFSLYMDMPMPMKIWNVYRSRFIGAFFQSFGINVIPTISWAERETYKFCFVGIPKGSIVSVSTVGVKNSNESLAIWNDGMGAMIDAIQPEAIIEYGGDVGFDYKDIKVVRFDNHVTKDWHDRE